LTSSGNASARPCHRASVRRLSPTRRSVPSAHTSVTLMEVQPAIARAHRAGTDPPHHTTATVDDTQLHGPPTTAPTGANLRALGTSPVPHQRPPALTDRRRD
jgi:hypothetical protein